MKQVSILTGGGFLMLKFVFLDSVAKGADAFLLKAFPNTFATSALWGFQITSQHQLGPLSLPQCSAAWMKMCLQRLDIPVTTVHFSAQKAISRSALHLWFIGRRVQTDNILAMWPWPLSTFVKASSEVRPNVCKQDVIKAGNWQGLTLRQCRAGREWPVRCQLALCSKCLHNN